MLVRHITAGLFASLVFACAPTAPSDDSADSFAGFSSTVRPVLAILGSAHAASEGTAWSASSDNLLGSDWIVQTPPAQYWSQPLTALPVAEPCDGAAACDPDFDLVECSTQADCTYGGTCTAVNATITAPGMQARSLCIGHSDAFVDRVYDLVASAQSLVDISSLEPPDGRFAVALRNALAFLARSGRAVDVRYVYGEIPGATLAGQTIEPDQLVALIGSSLPASSSVRLAVAAYRDGPQSWDHAKVIAIDRHTALVGGHNLLTQHYLQDDPAFDLSMVVSGAAAAQASDFVDTLWHFACNPADAELASTITIATFGDAPSPCDGGFAPPGSAGAGGGSTRIISVGRQGEIGDSPSDDALVALIGAAHTQLRISQQDIGGLGDEWPEPIIAALDVAIARGVDIQYVMSNIGAYPDHLGDLEASYSNGWTPADVVTELASYASANAAAFPGEMPQLICQHFSAAGLRHDPDDSWPDGAKFANHAKLVMADDAAFYIGSQNLYPADLAEFGFIVDDADLAADLLATYYAPLWAASKRSAISGPDATTCTLL